MSEVTTDPRSATDAVAADSVKRIPGEPGLWVFLLGDMIIFGVMFVNFLVARGKDAEVFAASRESVDLTIALTNTMVLLVSSLVVVLALDAVRRGRYGLAAAGFSGAIVCALVFISLKAVEYTHLIDIGHGPDANPYFMWLFILTGVHLSHVVIGVVVLSVLTLRARRGVAPVGSGRVVYEGGACYWHLVDLLWMVLFPVVYLVA